MLPLFACSAEQTEETTDAAETTVAEETEITEETTLDPISSMLAEQNEETEETEVAEYVPSHMEKFNKVLPEYEISGNTKTTYEIFVYSFADSNGDGIGDINGITENLDYIEEMGFDQIWLTPVTASTTYHKYDVTDYCEIDPEFGTMDDYETFLEECHNRGITVLFDFVMNHTSSQHPWFTEACEAIKEAGTIEDAYDICEYVGYYNFTYEAASGYYQIEDTGVYYEARFWSEMPDLNLKSAAVRSEIEKIAKFWLGKGVDGFRMDATTYYETGNNNTNIEILSWFNEYVKSVNPNAYIVCEGWTDSVTYLYYLESGVDSMFNFDFSGTSGRIANVVTGKSTAESFAQALVDYQDAIDAHSTEAVDAPFYTNHDMARAAGYYAGDNAEAQIKLGYALNVLMSGCAFVYYGEEIAMKGAQKDENYRAPMQWSDSSEYMCDGPADMGTVKMLYGTLEEQQNDPYSIWNYCKQATLLRSKFPVIGYGDTEIVSEYTDDDVFAITRCSYGDEDMEDILIIVNVSDETKTINIDENLCDYTVLAAVLETDENNVTKDGDTLTLPARDIAILTAMQ